MEKATESQNQPCAKGIHSESWTVRDLETRPSAHKLGQSHWKRRNHSLASTCAASFSYTEDKGFKRYAGMDAQHWQPTSLRMEEQKKRVIWAGKQRHQTPSNESMPCCWEYHCECSHCDGARGWIEWSRSWELRSRSYSTPQKIYEELNTHTHTQWTSARQNHMNQRQLTLHWVSLGVVIPSISLSGKTSIIVGARPSTETQQSELIPPQRIRFLIQIVVKDRRHAL